MFTQVVIAALFCLGAASLTQAAVKLADFVTPCSLKDPKLDDCLTTQGKALLPHLVAGVREWDILSLNPLLIPKIVLQQGNGGSAGLSLDLVNSKHYGWNIMIIKSIKLDPKTYEFQVDFKFPTYSIVSDYDVKGRILLLPIVGHGPANVTFVNADVQMTLNSMLEERGGKTYLKVVAVKTSINPEKIKFRFDNLFNNKQLSDTMNIFLNENSLDVYMELKSNILSTFNDILTSIVSRIFNKVPLKQLFADVN